MYYRISATLNLVITSFIAFGTRHAWLLQEILPTYRLSNGEFS
jgi:hypothetical protein